MPEETNLDAKKSRKCDKIENKDESSHQATKEDKEIENDSNYDDDYDYDINDNANEEDDDEDEKLFVADTKKAKVAPASASSSTSDDDDNDDDDDEGENSNSKTESDDKVAKINGEEKSSPPKQDLNDQNKQDAVEADAIAEKNLELSRALEEKTKILAQLHENVDYAIILAFLDKFAAHLSLKDLTFATLESYFTATKTLPRKLIDLHLKLMKNLPMGKHAKKDKWDYYLAKFVRRFSARDAQLIEDNAYLTCDVSFKVKYFYLEIETLRYSI